MTVELVEAQAAELKKVLEGTEFTLVSERSSQRKGEVRRRVWDVDVPGHKCIATVGCAVTQVRIGSDGKRVSPYGSSSKTEIKATAYVWIHPVTSVSYESIRDTDYTSADPTKNAKGALKRLCAIAKRIADAREAQRLREEQRDHLQRLTDEELGDVSDVYARNQIFNYNTHEKKPIEHLQRADNGEYRVTVRGTFPVEKVRAIIEVLRGTR